MAWACQSRGHRAQRGAVERWSSSGCPLSFASASPPSPVIHTEPGIRDSIAGSWLWLGRRTSLMWCWVPWLSVVCMGWVWLLLRLSPLGGRGWHPRPDEAIPRAAHGFRGRVPAGVGGLRWKRERKSYRLEHLPRAGDGVLVLGPGAAAASQSCWFEWGQRARYAVLWRGYGTTLVI